LPKLPDPPPLYRLAAITPEIQALPAGTRVWRVYFRGGRYPTHWDGFRDFGPTTARFDHHLPDGTGNPVPQDRAIQYAALDGVTPLAEVFQDTRTIDRIAKTPWLVAYDTLEELVLLDLTGTFPTRAGASMLINCGARAKARSWSQAFYAAYPQIQGLYYGSCMFANSPSLALYDRARSAAIPAHPVFHRALSDRALRLLLRDAAARMGYLLF
jgi:hypothetical protein